MSGIRLAVIAIIIFSSNTAIAGDSFRFGIMPGFVSFDVDDPNGPTETKSEFSPLSVVVINEFSRDKRLLLHGFYQDFEIEASTRNIGQEVTRSGASVSLQGLFRVTRGWKPWFGIGAGYAQESYDTRFTVDSGGFLATRFPDRTEDAFFGLVNASTEWALNREWDLGVHVQYEHPVADGARVFTVAVMVLY